MKKEFFDAIRSGRKRATLRLWKRRRVLPGRLHTVPGLGKVRIDDVREVSLAQLTEADAEADGFASLVQLRTALDRIYGPADLARVDGDGEARKLYMVRFTFMPSDGSGASASA